MRGKFCEWNWIRVGTVQVEVRPAAVPLIGIKAEQPAALVLDAQASIDRRDIAIRSGREQ